MRLLVGTMHTCEQELEACVAAIRAQKGVQFEHFVIEGESHLKSHRLLYGTFMERASHFDIFLKVDADMVIPSSSLFLNISERFTARPHLQWLMIAVQDFFPNRLVRGMHAYRSSVKWPIKDEKVFVDECPISGDEFEEDYRILAPAALHCPTPSHFQAFHYGLIRGVKVRAGLSKRWLNRECYGLIEDTWTHTKATADRRLVLASLGAELALAGIFGPDHLDHACPLTSRALRLNEMVSTPTLMNRVRYRRVLNRLLHPSLVGRAGL